MNHDNQLTSTPRHKCCDPTVMAADAIEDEELRFCFNIDTSEDEFYQNLNPKVSFFFLKYENMNTGLELLDI